ncbi:MAG: cytochrome o ubiquinol oxidase subunit IV [Janthinobacterium lividum]
MSTSPLDPALHAHDGPHGHGSRRGYRIGSVLSVILTAVPFWLVMSGSARPGVTAGIIFALALVQIVVHVVCFLHLDTRSEGGWTLLAFLFTAVIVVLTIGGSIWIMFHLNSNMMPMPGGAAAPVR